MNAHEPWHEMETTARVERRLQQMYERPSPDPRFLARLEGELRERTGRGSRWTVLRLRRAWALAFLLIAILAGGLWLRGPGDAWAQFLRLIGYAPHVGFVNVEEARILPAPVTRQIGDVTVEVQQVVATKEETRVVVHVKGLAVLIPTWTKEEKPPFTNLDVTLRASDGSRMRAQQSAATMGEGEGWLTFSFPPLPPNVYQVELDLSAVAQEFRLPAGDWRIPLVVYPANSALVANVLSEPYEPDVAPQTHGGITLRLLRVAHTPGQTALQIQAEFPEQYIGLMVAQHLTPLLYDDLGHVYYRPPDGGTQTVVGKEVDTAPLHVAKKESPNTRTTTWEDVRAPVSALARRLTYVIPEVTMMVPVAGSFTLDLGEHPQPGEVWPLDVSLDVDGVPVRIERAVLLDAPGEHAYRLVFSVKSSEVGGKAVAALTMDASDIRTIQERSGGPDAHSWVVFDIPKDSLPRGTLTVRVREAMMTIKGPWRFEWDIPRPALPPSVGPVVLHPKARASDRGITLRVDTLTLTDRVTVFDLDATVPEGTTFEGVSARLVEDGTGHAQKPQWHIQWCREEEGTWEAQPIPGWPPSACGRAHPGRIVFGPLPPTTRSVTLKVNAVTLFRRAPVALTLSLPRHRTPDTEVKGRPAIRLDVDARIQAGAIPLHFTRGWLLPELPPEVWLLSEPISRDVLESGYLSMPLLQVRGDGRTLSPAWGGASTLVWEDENCVITPDACRDKPVRVLLRVPLVDVSPDALPSRLDITLAGVQWQVPGTWNLTVRPERLFWQMKGK